MSQQQHTQEAVAILIPTYEGNSYQPLNGHMPSEVTLLYTFPPDAAARIAELESQRDTLLKLVECISQQTPEKPDYWSSCSQCEHNISDAEDAIASVKEKA